MRVEDVAEKLADVSINICVAKFLHTYTMYVYAKGPSTVPNPFFEGGSCGREKSQECAIAL